jgi:hypothetical protein
MGLFITSDPGPLRGVFAQSVPPPAVITPAGTSTSVIVGQFPWGPPEQLTYPGDFGTFGQTYAPKGMTRTGSAWLSVIRKGFPVLGAVRVADTSGGAIATTTLVSSSPENLVTIPALYQGSQGNSIIATVGAASDGNANHWNLIVSVSSASGTTSELYQNNNVSGLGPNVLPNTTNSVLIGTPTFLNSGNPVPGNYVLGSATPGADGTVTANMYVGTPGTDDLGFSLLESDDTIDFVFTDDPGNTFRPTVNQGLTAHAILTSDRIGCLNGNSGNTAAQAQTDVANYRSINVGYVDPWAYISDDTDETIRNCPSSCWMASVGSQIPPSLSISARMQAVTGLLQGISKLEANRGAFRSQNTQAGIATLIPGQNGGFTFEAGVNTSGVPGQTNITRTRMGIYIAESATESWYPYIDAPNVPFFQQDLVNSLQAFLQTLKGNATINPAALPYILNFGIAPIAASNTAASLANGDFTVATQVQIGSNMSRIFLSMQYGETVVVSVA